MKNGCFLMQIEFHPPFGTVGISRKVSISNENLIKSGILNTIESDFNPGLLIGIAPVQKWTTYVNPLNFTTQAFYMNHITFVELACCPKYIIYLNTNYNIFKLVKIQYSLKRKHSIHTRVKQKHHLPSAPQYLVRLSETLISPTASFP